MDPGDPAYRGQRDYTRVLLNLYDPLVLGPIARFVWRCSSSGLLDQYRRYVRDGHLDVGPGTGYFLERSGLPAGRRVTILDPNRNVLRHVSRRLKSLEVTAVEADVLKPLPVSGPFASAALNLVIHCLPGPLERKALAIANVATVLAPTGVLFGASVIGGSGRHNPVARGFLAVFNRQGGFDNLDDTEDGLREILAASFEQVELRTVGSVALFVARNPWGANTSELDDDHDAAPGDRREAVRRIPPSDPASRRRAGRGGGFSHLGAAALLVAGVMLASCAGGFRSTSVVSPSPSDAAVEASDPSPIASLPATSVPTGTAPTEPTPLPTPSGELAAGFTWTGAPTSIPPSREAPTAGETATLLEDGRVLVTAGCATAAETYDPTTDAFTRTGDLGVVRAGKAATLLRDGRVLFAGGYNCAAAGQDGTLASAEIYDPRTGVFTATGAMRDPRQFHSATLLADGRVLISGGHSDPPATTSGIILASDHTAETSASTLASAEVYDPATGTFSETGSMSSFRDNHTATLLEDGRVLVAGGGGEGYASSTSAEVYDPATGTFTKTASMHTGRWLHTATLLDDGRVLILGGRSPQDSVYESAEIYDPEAGAFANAGLMREGRQQHTATLLDDGRVLIVGGYWSDGSQHRVLSSAEMYDPASATSSTIGPIGAPRQAHVATRLADGRVLIVGGIDIGEIGAVPVPFGVLYQP